MIAKVCVALCVTCMAIDVAMGWWALAALNALGAGLNLYILQRTS